MELVTFSLENYRGVGKRVKIGRLGRLVSIVGQNDSGKSTLLYGIATFLNLRQYPLGEEDFNRKYQKIVMEGEFWSPDLEEKIKEHLGKKLKKRSGIGEFVSALLGKEGRLKVKRVKNPPSSNGEIGEKREKSYRKWDKELLKIEDYRVEVGEERFETLYGLSERELNRLLEYLQLEIPSQGKGKNSRLEKVKHIHKWIKKGKLSEGVKVEKIEGEIGDNYGILELLPSVELFPAQPFSPSDSGFRTHLISELEEFFAKEEETFREMEKRIRRAMAKEGKGIKGYLKEYIPNLKQIQLEPEVVWENAIREVEVKLQLKGESRSIGLTRRGSGYQRLFLVARFRYLAEKEKKRRRENRGIIYLLEEPETFLHPSLQRDLLEALTSLSRKYQIILTTHSPIFVGSSDSTSLILSQKGENGEITYQQPAPNLEERKEFLLKIAEDLGITPDFNLRDNYHSILFVESPYDAQFYQLIAQTLLGVELAKAGVLVIPFGGGGNENIRYFVDLEFFASTGRRLYLIIDSDQHLSQSHREAQREKIEFFQKYGKAYLLHRSTIENYYHPRAVERVLGLETDSLPLNLFDPIEEIKEQLRRVLPKKVGKRLLKNIKNNFQIFQEMTPPQWEEVVEPELLEFLKEIVTPPQG